MEPVDVVDINDTVIKVIDRKDQTPEDIVRCAEVIIINNKDEILLQLRSSKKERFPQCWSLNGGHVDSGENYEEATKREHSLKKPE